MTDEKARTPVSPSPALPRAMVVAEAGAKKQIEPKSVEDLVTAREDYESSTWLQTILYTICLTSQFCSYETLIYFPIDAFSDGGWIFLMCYTVIILLVGFPCVYFDCVIGQLTQCGLTKAFGTFGKAFRGVGYALAGYTVYNAISKSFFMSKHVDVLYSSILDNDGLVECPPNDSSCMSLWEAGNCLKKKKMLYYINNTCENKSDIAMEEINDASFLHLRSVDPSQHGSGKVFNVQSFIGVEFAWMIVIGVGMFGIVAVMIAEAAALISRILLFLVLMMTFVFAGDISKGLVVLQSKTDSYKMFTLAFWLHILMVVLRTLRLGLTGLVSLSSYRYVTDNPFFPVLIAFGIHLFMAFLSMFVLAGSLGFVKQNESYFYLFHSFKDYNLFADGFLVQFTRHLGQPMLIILSMLRIFTDISLLTPAVYLMLTLARDHINERHKHRHRIVLGGLLVIVSIASITLSINFGAKFISYTISFPLDYWAARFLVIGTFIIVLHVYGPIDLFADMCTMVEEVEDWRRWLSPIGPTVLFFWGYFCPIVLLVMQVLTAVDLSRTDNNFSNEDGSWVPKIPHFVFVLALLCLVPGFAIFYVLSYRRINRPLDTLILPTPGHPGYNRVTENFEEEATGEIIPFGMDILPKSENPMSNEMTTGGDGIVAKGSLEKTAGSREQPHRESSPDLRHHDETKKAK